MLTGEQQDEIRRALGYPSSGQPATAQGPGFYASLGTGAGMLGFPTDPANVGLDFRLNNLAPNIEVKIVGADHPLFDAYCVFGGVDLVVTAATPAVNDPVFVAIGGRQYLHAIGAGETASTIAAAIALLISLDPQFAPLFFTVAIGNKVQVRATQWGNQFNAMSVVAYSGASASVAVYQPGTSTATTRIFGGNTPPGPFFIDPTAQQPTMPIIGHLPLIRFWEAQIPLANDTGMDTIKAPGGYQQNVNEWAKRKSAWIEACRDLAQELGIHYCGGGDFRGGGGSRRRTT